jgi:CRISPR-associated protein Csx16
MTIFAPWIVAPGDVVIGTLSNETAATIHQRLGTYLHLELNLPADALNTELTADTLRECGARLNYFELTASNMKNCLRPLQIKC